MSSFRIFCLKFVDKFTETFLIVSLFLCFPGDIRGSILYSLYEEYSSYFRIGSVLVLKQFGVLSAGYNNHCLTITPNNLISIYCLETPRKLPNEDIDNIYGESSSEDSVKKILIQDCNVEQILKKYNEDVLDYSQENQKKVNIGNLNKKSSDGEVTTRYNCKNNNYTTINNFILQDKPQSSRRNASKAACRANNNTNMLSSLNTVPGGSSPASADTLRHNSPVQKFIYKKQFDVCESNKTAVNNNIRCINDNKMDRENKTCDSIIVTNQISVKLDNKEHAEIWKNLLEDIDTDSLFDDF